MQDFHKKGGCCTLFCAAASLAAERFRAMSGSLRAARCRIFTREAARENGICSACFLRKCGAAGTAKDLISEENGRVQREQTGEHTLFFTQKIRKNL